MPNSKRPGYDYKQSQLVLLFLQGKKFCIVHELGNKTQLSVWVLHECCNGFSRRAAAKPSKTSIS